VTSGCCRTSIAAGKASLLEGRVPGLESLADRLPIAKRHRLLDPGNDRLLRRRDRRRGIGLFKVPAVDVADESILIHLLGEVLESRDEVAHTVVGEPRSVGILRQETQRIVDGDRGGRRLSGTVSISAVPLEAYVAATCSSTLSGNAFTLAQVVRSRAKEKPGSCRRSAASRSRRSTRGR